MDAADPEPAAAAAAAAEGPEIYIAPEVARAIFLEEGDEAMFARCGMKCLVCYAYKAHKPAHRVTRLVDETTHLLNLPMVTAEVQYVRLARRYNLEIVQHRQRQREGRQTVPQFWNASIVRRHYQKCPNSGADICRLQEQLLILEADIMRFNSMVWYMNDGQLRFDRIASGERDKAMRAARGYELQIYTRRRTESANATGTSTAAATVGTQLGRPGSSSSEMR